MEAVVFIPLTLRGLGLGVSGVGGVGGSLVAVAALQQ